MHRLIKTVALLACAAIFFLPAPRTARAVTMSPVKSELTADPGQRIQTKFILTNERNDTNVYYLTSQNFNAKDESGTPLFSPEKDGFASWIQVQSSVILGPKEQKEITYSITIPKTVEPGGYFAGIFASSIAPEQKDNGDVSVESQVGTLLLLRVNEQVTEATSILEFFAKNKQRLFSSLPVDYFFRFQNSGQSWAKPLGDVIIKNGFGRVSKVIPANAEGSNVLPKSIRRFEGAWLTNTGSQMQDPKAERPPTPPEGFWNKVKHEWKYFAFGRYTANLTLTYNNDTNTATNSKFAFWVIPWHFLTVAVPSGIILLLILGFIIKHYNKHIVARAQKRK